MGGEFTKLASAEAGCNLLRWRLCSKMYSSCRLGGPERLFHRLPGRQGVARPHDEGIFVAQPRVKKLYSNENKRSLNLTKVRAVSSKKFFRCAFRCFGASPRQDLYRQNNLGEHTEKMPNRSGVIHVRVFLFRPSYFAQTLTILAKGTLSPPRGSLVRSVCLHGSNGKNTQMPEDDRIGATLTSFPRLEGFRNWRG